VRPSPPAPGPLERSALLEQLSSEIQLVRADHPIRVAIDGVDAAGKTFLADELVEPLAKSGREVIRASIDGFHRPRAERMHRGPESPEGYYLDSFDHEVFDGVFLLRPELIAAWDFKIFLEVDFNEAVRRATTRDRSLFGSPEAAVDRHNRRYLPGQRIYLDSVHPQDLADVAINNSDPTHPVLLASRRTPTQPSRSERLPRRTPAGCKARHEVERGAVAQGE
jgi:uridine kinase